LGVGTLIQFTDSTNKETEKNNDSKKKKKNSDEEAMWSKRIPFQEKVIFLMKKQCGANEPYLEQVIIRVLIDVI
jgi:hypothetical protein